jgi:hypothetical protein
MAGAARSVRVGCGSPDAEARLEPASTSPVRSLSLDVHGKTFASLLLSLPLRVDPSTVTRVKERAAREHV